MESTPIPEPGQGMRLEAEDNNDSNSEIAHVIPPNTGSWPTFAEESLDISVVTGEHTVYLYFHDANQNIYIDWIEFGSTGIVTPIPTPEPTSVPGNTPGDVNGDGGTLNQNDTDLVWNDRGFYEVSLNEGELRLTP